MTDILEQLEREEQANWLPFSPEGEHWHTCPGHLWHRMLFHLRNANRNELITRCQCCGAPRCDCYYVKDKKRSSQFKKLTDHQQQYYRCTMERHHRDEHDFLDGSRVPISG